ncbi:hypothetical protein ACKKBF_B12815 [Auxenochlorella protothecoides x Auxenochlorella symbiontica]
MPESAKTLRPPSIVGLTLASHANAKTALAVLNNIVKAEKDHDIEKVVHYITFQAQLQSAASKSVLIPAIKEEEDGESLAKSLVDQWEKVDAQIKALDKTKKHLSNPEFTKVLAAFQEALEAAYSDEHSVLKKLADSKEEDVLEEQAKRAESAKQDVNLDTAAA